MKKKKKNCFITKGAVLSFGVYEENDASTFLSCDYFVHIASKQGKPYPRVRAEYYTKNYSNIS